MPTNHQLRQASRVIRAGGIIAYPTEAVFGLGCDPVFETTIQTICAMKGRHPSAGFILIADHLARLDGWIAPTDQEQVILEQPANGSITRAITWVVTAGPLANDWVTGGRETAAVRLVDHPVAAALCEVADTPLISTSANRSGKPPIRTALAVRQTFRTEIDYIVNGATSGIGNPSEIRRASDGTILRAG